MRIIAGRLGGRMFASPHSPRTHPMSDKLRNALFNVLGDIEGLMVLDPFGGSGALSFEAVSRGAEQSVIIENDKPAQRTIDENIVSLQLSQQVRLVRAGATSWSRNNPDARFDILLADPPFDRIPYDLVQLLVKHVTPGGLYVLNWPGKVEEPRLTGLEFISRKPHGDAKLFFYRRPA